MITRIVLVCLFSNLILTPRFISSQPICRDHERISLLKFKESFTIDKSASGPLGHPKTHFWTDDEDCCLWDGVECNNETSHVISLDLSSSFLYGSLHSNSTLFDLVQLRSLNLADNNFNFSRIPSSLRYLSSLDYLNMSFSFFSGQIPSEISLMSKLSSLDLSLNIDPIGGENLLQLKLPVFESLVRNLTCLEKLHLGYVDISSSLPSSLTNLTSLRSLLLGDCGLKGEFPVSIFHLPKLQTLNVQSNQDLTGKIPSLMPSSSLKVLILAGTDFSGELPSSIGQHSSLTELDIGDCKFSGLIPSSLGKLNQLTYLNLADNSLRGFIPSFVGNLTQLKYLAFSNNDFSNGTLSWVGNLTKLEYLDLANSSLIGLVPPSFSKLTSLEVINLGDNDLSGKIDFDTFLSLINLTDLRLSRNRLEVIIKHSVNSTLPQFESLVMMSCQIKAFPSFLRYQQRMSWLDLNDNQIAGQIPEWFMNISVETMELISLSNNFLTGFEQSPVLLPWLNLWGLILHHNMLNCTLPIPPKSTIHYSISHNNLRGKVSSMICNAHSLVNLYMSDNKLDGELPPCLGNFSNLLMLLDVSNNSFYGDIPPTFLPSNQLRKIDFSNNRLRGKLPRSLANCRALQYLGVGNNELTDVFPFWLGILPELEILMLRDNRFYGNIEYPPTNFEFPKLRIIDLAYNNFTGKLPSKYMAGWKAMKNRSTNSGYMESTVVANTLTSKYSFSVTITIKGFERLYVEVQNALAVIDLSNNKFNGEIPQVIRELKGLISLDLSNNNLSGRIPPSLGNLSELESMDLSRNIISGHIPRELTRLTFLQYFNVSHNELVGPIPQEGQLSRFESSSYEGNLGLCGILLTNKCVNSEGSLDSQPPSVSEDETLGFGWKVVLIGYSCGFVVGAFMAKVVVSRRPRWLRACF